MLIMRVKPWVNVGLVLLLGGSSSSLLPAARADDPVHFSNTGDKIKSPVASVPGANLDKPGGMFKSQEPSDNGVNVLEPLSISPQGTRSRRMLELIDQRKNWMFRSPGDLGDKSSLEDSLGSKEPGFDGKNIKLTRMVERFLQETNQTRKKNQAGRTNEDAEGGDSRLRDDQSSLSPFEPGKRGGTLGGLNQGFSPFADRGMVDMGVEQSRENLFPNAGLAPNSPLSPVYRSDPSDRLDPAFTQKKRMEGFMQMLRSDSPASPLSDLANTLNNPLADTTRQSLQPVMPKGLGSMTPALRPDALNTLPQLGGLNRGGLPDDSGLRVLGSSSLSPAIAPGPEPRYAPLPPAVFVMPQRKF